MIVYAHASRRVCACVFSGKYLHMTCSTLWAQGRPHLCLRALATGNTPFPLELVLEEDPSWLVLFCCSALTDVNSSVT